MSNDRSDAAVAEGLHKPQRVAHVVHERVWQEIVVEGDIRSRASSIASLVRRDDMKASRGQETDLFSPAKGKFGEAME